MPGCATCPDHRMASAAHRDFSCCLLAVFHSTQLFRGSIDSRISCVGAARCFRSHALPFKKRSRVICEARHRSAIRLGDEISGGLPRTCSSLHLFSPVTCAVILLLSTNNIIDPCAQAANPGEAAGKRDKAPDLRHKKLIEILLPIRVASLDSVSTQQFFAHTARLQKCDGPPGWRSRVSGFTHLSGSI